MISSSLISTTLQLGLIYSLVAFGIYLTYRIVNFPDLTVDGSFPLGAAVAASLLYGGHDSITATIVAFLAGCLAGLITSIIHIQLRIMGILAGILTMTGLYSIIIRIMGGPNIALLDVETIFSSNYATIILLGIVLLIGLGLYLFLISELGLAIRVTGKNPRMAQANGINTALVTTMTLIISNGLVAMAGALFAELQGFADVSIGTGTLVIGLASVIIGETILPIRRISSDLIACMVGAVIFRFVIALALSNNLFGLQASDLNLVTTLLIIGMLFIPSIQKLVFAQMRPRL